jgi:hypothetical protein
MSIEENMFNYAEITSESSVAIVGIPKSSKFYAMFQEFQEEADEYIDPVNITDYETAETLMETLLQYAMDKGYMDEDAEDIPFIIDNVIKVKDVDMLIITVVEIAEDGDELDEEPQDKWTT